MLVPLIHGITVILEPVYNFELFYQHILKYRPNFLVTATGLLDYLMNKQPKSESYRKFKYLAAGGEYVTSSAEQNTIIGYLIITIRMVCIKAMVCVSAEEL